MLERGSTLLVKALVIAVAAGVDRTRCALDMRASVCEPYIGYYQKGVSDVSQLVEVSLEAYSVPSVLIRSLR